MRKDGLEAVHHLDFTEHEYQQARATDHRLSRAEGVDAVLRRYRLDALVMPTPGPPAKFDLIRSDGYAAPGRPPRSPDTRRSASRPASRSASRSA
ncbi:hypothetical protein [Streptomyces cellulosae]|uniref:Uncharacterized protein n=1 Tax=Streptomyces cellulosae TaxID=1968 RepID=A0ABW7XZH0_STRCE